MSRSPLVQTLVLVAMVTGCRLGASPPKEPPHTETVTDAGAPEAPPPQKTLYERLGERQQIARIVDTFVKNLQVDTRVSKRLSSVKGAKLEKFKKDVVDLVCVESGGTEAGADCTYEGRFMKEVLGPKGRFKEEEWSALTLDFRTALEEHAIGEAEQQELASMFAKFHDDVVERKPTKKK
jgi:truncated hemoglobin YjbI